MHKHLLMDVKNLWPKLKKCRDKNDFIPHFEMVDISLLSLFISIIKLGPLSQGLMCSLWNASCIKQAIFNEQFNVNGF